MDELIKVAERISSASGAVLLLLALVGGYRKWWAWGYQLTECENRCGALIAAAERREGEWKELALNRAMPIAREAVNAIKGGQDTARRIASLPEGNGE